MSFTKQAFLIVLSFIGLGLLFLSTRMGAADGEGLPERSTATEVQVRYVDIPRSALRVGDIPEHLDGRVIQLADALRELGETEHYRVPEVERYARLCVREGYRRGIAPEVLCGLVWVESRFRRDVVSSAGACGPAQILPREVFPESDRPTCEEATVPEIALAFAADYLDNTRSEGGHVRPCRYNGNCLAESAQAYERSVWRVADWLTRR